MNALKMQWTISEVNFGKEVLLSLDPKHNLALFHAFYSNFYTIGKQHLFLLNCAVGNRSFSENVI